jgi:hypothetical protein
MAAGADMMQTAIRTTEATAAAGRVVRERSAILSAAFENPLAADYAELSLMVPEKMAAAGQSVSDVMTEGFRIWADAARAWPSMANATAKPVELTARTMGLFGMALAPYHRAVTRNDRRLRRKRR